jgi:cytochrome bd ubiquinol oxidase subunit II
MLNIIIIILGISFLLYTVLGGADFGAGILETFIGRRGETTVSKAIAPVWEANHIWLILATVIMFTGFPMVYFTITLYLHIPILIVLIGIVLRGSAFIFRFYDFSNDPAHKYFTSLFKISSFITPVFLGVVIGAMMMGRINLNGDGDFYQRFIMPWFNVFCFTMGLFTAALFAYIAAVFLVGESTNDAGKKKYSGLAKICLALTFIFGLLVFITAQMEDLQLFAGLFNSIISIIAFTVAVLLIPVIIYLFNHPNVIYLRGAIGLQVALFLLGWFAIHFPVVLYEKNGNHLSLFNANAPDASLYQLMIALFVGLILVMPAFYFLFKVFKKANISEG